MIALHFYYQKRVIRSPEGVNNSSQKVSYNKCKSLLFVIHSVKMSFNKFRTVSFKLKRKLNIDELVDKENFEMKRTYMIGNEVKTDVISCKIMGIRKPRTDQDIPRPTFDGTENDVQWVEISGCQYAITEGELKCWMGLYGEILLNLLTFSKSYSLNIFW